MKTILLIATVVLLLAALPAQAQVKTVDVIDAVTSIVQCDCEEGEAELTEPPKDPRMVDDGNWGGDPDYAGPPDRYWVHYLWLVMKCTGIPEEECSGYYNIIY